MQQVRLDYRIPALAGKTALGTSLFLQTLKSYL